MSSQPKCSLNPVTRRFLLTYVDPDHKFQEVPYTGSKKLTFIGGPVVENGVKTVACTVKIGR